MQRYEDEKNPEEALRLYHKCLNIAPNHKEARSSIQALSKSRQKPNFNIDFLENGAAAKNGAGGGGDDSAGQAAAAGDLQDGGAGGQKVKERHRKRTTSSSSSSSSSSSASRFSSSDSNSSAARSRRKKKKSSKSSRSKKEASLSPFSKKMAQLNPLENPLLQPDSALPAAPFYPLEAPHPVPAPQFRNCPYFLKWNFIVQSFSPRSFWIFCYFSCGWRRWQPACSGRRLPFRLHESGVRNERILGGFYAARRTQSGLREEGRDVPPASRQRVTRF